MWLSDRAIGGVSAYSKVTYECCTRLAKMGHSVAHIPMGRANKLGKNMYEGVLFYPSGDHPLGEDVAIPHYTDFKADMLIVLKELWNFSSIHRFAINFVPYCIIDHSPVSTLITSRMQTAFKVLVPSKFGQRELKHADIESTYIPHAVRTDLYKPLDKAECRKNFYLDPDEFIVGIVAMNRSRKMIPRMLQGYKRFLEMNPDIKSHLMLWTNVNPSTYPEDTSLGVGDVGVYLLPEIMQLGLGEAVRWPQWEEIDKIGGLPEWDPTGGWDMVKLYSCFDVLLLCSGGEGFGLPLIEAQACGVPVVTTDYAAGPEQVGAGLTIPWKDYLVLNTPGTRYALADIDKMAEALTKIANADREKLSKKARSFAERYDYSRIMEQFWKPFLDSCELELRPKISKEALTHW
jgi:glycosyltransferase involved in cell wall biosynthesis